MARDAYGNYYAGLTPLPPGSGGGGGGSGSGNVIAGHGAPSTAPADGNGVYYDEDTGFFYAWNAATSHWDPLIT